MTTILVTGGAGFIGSNFVLDTIANTNFRIVNLDKLTYAGNSKNLDSLNADPRHILVRGDIADSNLVANVLAQHQPVAIINFAAETHVDRSIDEPSAFIHTNIIGVYRLLEESCRYWDTLSHANKKHFRFVHISTDEVYGSLAPDAPPFSEKHPYFPNSPYAASKASADHLVRAYHRTYGLPTITTNCSNNYGPYQHPEKLIPLMILTALDGRPLPIYGDGGNIRDWLFVLDHCAAIRQILTAGRVGESYNIGGNSERTNLELVKSICALLDELVPNSQNKPHAQLISFIDDRPGHDRRYAISAEKTQHEIGWAPAETLTSGLEKTVRWYLDNQAWCKQIWERSRRGARLGRGRRASSGSADAI